MRHRLVVPAAVISTMAAALLFLLLHVVVAGGGLDDVDRYAAAGGGAISWGQYGGSHSAVLPPPRQQQEDEVAPELLPVGGSHAVTPPRGPGYGTLIPNQPSCPRGNCAARGQDSYTRPCTYASTCMRGRRP